MPRVWMPRISRRPGSSGTPTTISRSKRPGRRSASSSASGRLVAAMTTVFWRGSIPSSRVSSWATRRFSASPVTWPRLGAIEIDLVDEDDRRRALRRLLEQFAQPPLALAIGRAHDLGPGDVEELGGAFVGDGARKQGLAGAGRAVEQHALGRIDAEPLEQLGMAQRKLDHLAQRIDRVAHAAEIVIGDVGAALTLAVPRRYIPGRSSTAVLPSIWTMPLGAAVTTTSRSSCSAKAGAFSSCRMLSGMSALIRWWPAVATVSPSTSGRPAKLRFSASAEPCSRTLGWAGAKTTRVAGLEFGLADLDEIARADAGIGALEAVEADDVDALRPRHRAGWRAPRSSACRRSR